MKPIEVIYVYAQQCTLGGYRCYRDTTDRDDVIALDVTVSEYKRLRRLSRRARAGTDLFYRHCANAVMEAMR